MTNSIDDLESLTYLLVHICNLDKAKVNDITKYYKSITELINNINTTNKFELTDEEKTKIVRFCHIKRRAELDIEETNIIYGENNNLKTVINYAFTKSEEEDINEERKRWYEENRENFEKIYENQFNRIKAIQQNGKKIQLVGNFITNILPTMAKLANRYPFMSKFLTEGFLSISDEMLAMFNQMGIVKGNAISGLVIFGSLTVISFRRNLIRYIKEKDSGTFTTRDFLSCMASEMAIYGASSFTIATFGMAGGLIGTCFPVIGNLIGGIVGSLVGLIISSKLVDPFFLNWQKKLVLKKLEPNIDISMYKESLRKFNIDENTTVSTIKDLRRIYMRENHPDKNMTNQTYIDEKTKKFIELEVHFRTIEAFRKANNTWKD